MLTIKRHFPINKLALSKLWYGTKQLFPRVSASFAGGITDLRERSQAMGKKSILSSLVLMVGFFGSLSALLILYPIATREGGPFSGTATRANVGSPTEASTSGTWPKDSNSAANSSQAAGEQAKGAVPATQPEPLATSPVSPAPASSPAPTSAAPSVSAPVPVVSQPTTPAPVASSPILTAPSTATSPLPATGTPLDPVLSSPLPTVNTDPVAPVTNMLPSATQPIEDTADSLLK